MTAQASIQHSLAFEPSGAAETLAPANVKSLFGTTELIPAKANTASVNYTDPPPNVIVPFSALSATRPGVLTTSTATREPLGGATSLEEKRAFSAENLVRLPTQTPIDYWYDVRQQWEGVVTSVGSDEFVVVLRDLRRDEAPEYEAVLPIEELSEDDLPLPKDGAVLYWTIGYKTRAGTKERVSTIRLRRLPAWSSADIKRVQKEARELDDLFKDE